MSKRSIKIVIAAEGEDFQIQFRRFDGYSLYFLGEYVGGFDSLTAALAERDRLAFAALSSAGAALVGKAAA